VVGALIVYGTPQVLTLFADELGLGDTLAGLSPTVISLYVYGLAVILVVLFEPGGLAAIGRRLTGFATRRRHPDGTAATTPRPVPPGEDRS
jgi:branched-chain amino acid transport system permease protein